MATVVRVHAGIAGIEDPRERLVEHFVAPTLTAARYSLRMPKRLR